jgi:Tol biopolymer transport system component
MNRLDIAAWGLILVLALALSGVYLRGSQVDLEVDLKGASAQHIVEVGPIGPLEFVFSRPVQQDLLSSLINISPAVPGKITWDDFEHALFIPDQSFLPGVQYRLTLNSGALGKSGEKIKEAITWEFTLRTPIVAFLSKGQSGNELWASDPSGSEQPEQLTHTEGKVFNYAPSPNGQQIAYSAFNQQKGVDLWVVDRDGGENHVILDCGSDFCSIGSWSPDSRRIAYNRQSAGLSPGSGWGAPKPWLLDIKTGETESLFTDPQVIGYGPSWSPDGQKIATFDGVDNQIQILDLNTKKDTIIPTNSGLLGNWSPDSQKMYFTDTQVDTTTQHSSISVADLATGENLPFLNIFGLDPKDNFDVPAISPKGDWMAVSVQSDLASPAHQIWLIPLNGDQSVQVTSDSSFTNDFYSWNYLGTGLIFHRDALGSSKPISQVVVWWVNSRKIQIIAQDAYLPGWLP